jgi:hypothetical protein
MEKFRTALGFIISPTDAMTFAQYNHPSLKTREFSEINGYFENIPLCRFQRAISKI